MTDKKAKTKGPTRKGKKFGVRKMSNDINAGANQWQGTGKQTNFIRFYMDAKNKKTFGNAYQSAIEAGYSESYASRIMTPSMGLQWAQQAKNIARLNPEHLKVALVEIINDRMSKDADKIAAIKLLGVDQGMFTQKSVVAHVGIEEALNSLVD